MKKEQVKKFDLEAAFKALDEIEIPVAEKGIRANRVDLKERFSQKPAYETLVEDYYDIGDNEALEEAQEDREGEVAKAKLSRIEKIVDLDAETADDLLQSYVGRYIIQCPQCMTLFYKKPEDIEYSEENPDVVNINEICQHCGNSSGYTLVGKVDAVKEDEAANYEPEEEENELDLDFDTEVAEEEPAEEENNEEAGEEELDLDLNLEEIPEEEEEKKEESFQASGETVLNETIETESLNKSEEAPSDFETENGSENLTLNEEATDESLNKSEEAPSENASENTSEETTLNEEVDKDLDAKLKAHNDYIAYLQAQIKQEEEALKRAGDNEEIKAAIQRRLDAYTQDLQDALPEVLKNEPEANEVAVAEEPVEEVAVEEEAPAEEPVEEALTEETNECEVILSDSGKEVFSGSKEDCEKIIEKNKDTETAKEHGLEIKEPAVEESLNVSEEAPSEEESENKSENTTLNESVELNEGADEETKLADFEAELPEPEQQVNEAAEPTTAKEVEDSLSNFINDLDKSEEAPVEESLNESNDVEAALAEFVRNLPLDGMSENLQEANKADNFNVSDKEFSELINSDVFNEDLPSSSVVDAIVDRIKNAGNDVEENLEECGVKEECENGECKEDEPIKAEEALTEDAEEEATEEEQPAEAEEEAEEEKAEEEAQPIETTVEEVKEVATEVAEEVVEEIAPATEDTEAVQEKIEEVVDEVVEEKLGEEKSEEDEAEEADEEEVEFNEDDIEDIQEESFNAHVKDFLTEVYENVSDFAATSCELKEGKLIVEGKISFKSGKEKLTMFEFLPTYGEGKLFFEGYNKDFSEDKAFTLNCSLTEAKELITESFGYKYKINETLVEGLK